MYRLLEPARGLIVPLSAAVFLACSDPEPQATDAGSDPSAPPAAEASRAEPEVGTPASDIQDLSMPNPGQPFDGVVTGGQPTDSDLETLAARGFKTVVNLRTENEDGTTGEQAKVEGHGLRYISMPIANAGDLTEENARALQTLLDDASARPMLLHCGSSNRVGALVALAAFFAEELPADEALARGFAAGLSGLEGAVRERMTQGGDGSPN